MMAHKMDLLVDHEIAMANAQPNVIDAFFATSLRPPHTEAA